MSRAPALSALALLLAAGPALAAQPAIVRENPTATGPAITLGDVFENAGAAAARAIAPSPPPGRTTTLSPRLLQSAAEAAGLSWTPADGSDGVEVLRAGGPGVSRAIAPGEGVKKGALVRVSYATARLSLATQARAIEDAPLGAVARLENLQSGRTLHAIVTGPGSARAVSGVGP